MKINQKHDEDPILEKEQKQQKSRAPWRQNVKKIENNLKLLHGGVCVWVYWCMQRDNCETQQHSCKQEFFTHQSVTQETC